MFGAIPLDAIVGPFKDANGEMTFIGHIALGVLAVLAVAAFIAILIIMKNKK